MRVFLRANTPLPRDTVEHLSKKFELVPFSGLNELPDGLFMALSAPVSNEILDEYRALVARMIFISDDPNDSSFEGHFSRGCADFLFAPLKPQYLECKIKSLYRGASKIYTQAARNVIVNQLSTPLTHKEERLLMCLLEAGRDGSPVAEQCVLDRGSGPRENTRYPHLQSP